MTTSTKPKPSTALYGRGTINGIEFEVHECGDCNVLWAMTAHFIKSRRADLKGWKCPNGHSWVFHDGPTEEEQLKKEASRLRDRIAAEQARADQTEASLRATRGVVTRQKRQLGRVQNGVCPKCNRHFVNLERHMANKHVHSDE